MLPLAARVRFICGSHCIHGVTGRVRRCLSSRIQRIKRDIARSNFLRSSVGRSLTTHWFVSFCILCAVFVTVPEPASAGVVRDLRSFYFGPNRGDRKLRKRLLRRGLRRVLTGLRKVEPHVRSPDDMQRFETDHGGYYVRPPKGYRNRKSWPLHIELHGHGASQSGRVACRRYWKGEPARAGVILACPDLRSKWTSARGEKLVIATYKDVQRRMNVRTDRVSLGGFSGGGIGTWIIGPKYPDLFSAIIPRAGIPPRADEAIANLNGLSVYLVHGIGDATIPVKHSRTAVRALERHKIDHTYRERRGGHEFFGRLNNDILRWLKKRKRRNRKHFTYSGRLGGEPRIIHWVQLTGRGKVTVSGRISRRRRIQLTIDHPERLSQIDLWLSRRMVDMRRRQIDVVINGRPFGYRLRETTAAALDSYEITRDLRRVYTARVTVSKKTLRKVR